MLETRCRCKRVQRSKRKQKNSLEKNAWVPKMLIAGFQKVHGNGEDTWSRVDASTKRDQRKITMVTMCKVRKFKFPLIIDQGRNKMVPTRIDFCS